MVELECKDCLFFSSCCNSIYSVPCEHFSAYGTLEELMFDTEIDKMRDEYRSAWYSYVSEFDEDFSF